MHSLVIGCGNEHRGDDAAGLLVAQRLRALGMHAIECEGDGLALVELWRDQRCVTLIDAVVTGATPGRIVVLDANATDVGRDLFPTSTHAFGVGEAIQLANILGLLPKTLVIYGIEGASFGMGEQPSREVSEAVDQVANRIFSEWKKHHVPGSTR